MTDGNGTLLGIFRSLEGKLEELDNLKRAPCLGSGADGGSAAVEAFKGGRDAEALLFASTNDPSAYVRT